MKPIVLMNAVWAYFFSGLILAHYLLLAGVYAHTQRNGLTITTYVLIGFGLITIPLMFYRDFKYLGNINATALEKARQFKMRYLSDLSPEALDSVTKSSYLRANFLIVSAYSMSPGMLGLIAYIYGAPASIAYAMITASYVCMAYILWRLHTCWKKLYLN
jgi:hypothetical protein